MDNIIGELISGTLYGVHVRELESAIDIMINREIEKLSFAGDKKDSHQKLLLCLVTAKDFVRGKDSVDLAELQEVAAKSDELQAMGLLVSRGGGASKIAGALSRNKENTGESAINHALDNFHFMLAGHLLGESFCECMALQEGKIDGWIKEKARQSDRCVSRVPQNASWFAQWNVREVCELEELRKAKSPRVPIYEALSASSRKALEESLSYRRADDTSPPIGEKVLAQLLRDELRIAAEKLHLTLPSGLSV